jgi:hypothetical protein
MESVTRVLTYCVMEVPDIILYSPPFCFEFMFWYFACKKIVLLCIRNVSFLSEVFLRCVRFNISFLSSCFGISRATKLYYFLYETSPSCQKCY